MCISFYVYYGWNIYIYVFIFTRCVIQHLGLSENVLRDPLWSWGIIFQLFCFRRFRTRLWSSHITWWQSMYELVLMFGMILLVVSALFERLMCPLDRSFTADFLWDRSCPLVTFIKGIQVFLRDWFTIASEVPGSLFTAFCYHHTLTKKVLRVFIHSSKTDFIFVA